MAEVSMKMTKVQQEEGTHTLYIQTLTIEGEDSVWVMSSDIILSLATIE